MHTVLVHAFVPLLLHSPGHTRTARKSPDCALFRGLLLLLLLHRPAGGMAGGEGAFPLGLSWRRRGGVGGGGGGGGGSHFVSVCRYVVGVQNIGLQKEGERGREKEREWVVRLYPGK